MSIKNNFSALKLLANEPIDFLEENGTLSFQLIPPSVRDIFFNYDLSWFINFLDTDLEEIKKNITGYEVNSHYDFIIMACTLAEKREEIKELKDGFLSSLQILIPGISFSNKFLKIDNEIFIKEYFDEIIEILFKILKKEKIVIKDTDDDFTKKTKEMKLKAQRIRRNSKKEKEESGITIDQILIMIIEKFPQYKLSDLFDLNIYTFYYLFEYVGRIEQYEVSKIAYATGNTKKGYKLKHFIDK